MKTAEDEAFDDIERKQREWGGGFPAKRQMAIDKFTAEIHEEYIKYRTAFPKEYTAPQPAQEPVAYVTGVYGGRFVVAPLNPAIVLPTGMALYSTPQHTATWVGLTAEEAAECWTTSATKTWHNFEAKLKDKNI